MHTTQERAWTDLEVLRQRVLSKEVRVSIEEMKRCQQRSRLHIAQVLPNHLMWGL